MFVRTSTSLRALVAAAFATVAALFAAAPALAANESISGTVTDGSSAPLAGMCVTAVGAAADVLTTTATDGSYTLSVSPGDYVVRFDDCGTAGYETQYYDHTPDQDSANPVTVAADQQVQGVNGVLLAIPNDGGAPDTLIDTGPSGIVTDTGVQFEFHSPDDGNATYECSFDGGSFESCLSPQQYTELGDGPHHFEVRAVDALGNRDLTPEVRDFTIDSGAPNGRIDTGPSGTIYTRDVEFTFSSDKPDNSEYLCQLDNRGAEPCTSPQAYQGLDNGPHIFKLRARIRNGGPADQTPAIQTFYVDVNGPDDLDPPDTTITDGPSGTISTTATAFSFQADEYGTTYACQLDGGAFLPCQSPHVLTGLQNGPHTFSVLATDAAGNVEEAPATRSFTVDTTADTTPPDTAITSGPVGTVAQTHATFGFTSTEGNSTFLCSLDGAPFTNCTAPRTFTNLVDGGHTFAVQARDAFGNIDGSPASRTFTVDSSLPADVNAPDTAIDGGPDGPIATRTASFAFSSTEDGSSFECRLDNGPWRHCTSERTYSGVADGNHTFEVRATDPAGNRDTSPAPRSFSVDATPPETQITGGPDGTTINTSSTQYSFTASESPASFECRLDSGAWAGCDSPHPLSGLTTGTHTFAVRAIDGIGNVDGTPAVSAFTVDTTPPQTTIDAGPSGTVNQTSQSFTFHADEPAFFECRLDGGSWVLCDSPKDLSGLSQGSHTFEVRATDNAGNPDASPATRTFNVDSVAPNTTISSGPSGATNSASASFAFGATEAGSTFQCQMDSDGWGPCTSPQDFQGLSEGSHTFQVRATDAANNQDGTPASRTFSVDTAAPNTAITSGPSGTINSRSASFAFNSSESGSTFQCQMDSQGWVPCTSPRGYANLADGGHTFQVRSIDGVGNQDASAATRTFSVSIPPPPPTTDPECEAAKSKLVSAQNALKKAKAKLKKARSASAKRKAKKRVNAAKANVRKAQASVASAC